MIQIAPIRIIIIFKELFADIHSMKNVLYLIHILLFLKGFIVHREHFYFYCSSCLMNSIWRNNFFIVYKIKKIACWKRSNGCILIFRMVFIHPTKSTLRDRLFVVYNILLIIANSKMNSISKSSLAWKFVVGATSDSIGSLALISLIYDMLQIIKNVDK